ncbi:MAG: hypothetical protein MZV70_22260 [Desulfobacterales bacterium]|nr:hypothetical protein [Desulfobacterales bacterium]
MEMRIGGTVVLQMMEAVRLDEALDPWIFIVSLPKDRILEVPRRIYLELAVAELAILALLTALILATSRGISLPLVELTGSFDVIASGDLRTGGRRPGPGRDGTAGGGIQPPHPRP